MREIAEFEEMREIAELEEMSRPERPPLNFCLYADSNPQTRPHPTFGLPTMIAPTARTTRGSSDTTR